MCTARQVWCLADGSEQESQINRTVDGAVQSILLTGLLPDVRYTVVVAAVTSLGVGAHSPPVSLLLSESPTLLHTLQTRQAQQIPEAWEEEGLPQVEMSI